MTAIKSIKWDGTQITKAGIYSGIPLDLYHDYKICDGPSISSSGLRKLNPDVGSPRHFYSQWQGNPNRIDRGDKKHFTVGRAVHHLILGEQFFAKLFCIQPLEYEAVQGELKAWNNNANICRQWQEARKKEGRAVLTHSDIATIKQVATSVGNHPLVKNGILNGQIERSLFWKDKETGIWLKWRPDAIPTDSADFGELKTCQSVHYPDLVQTIRKFAYYQQGALGMTACREVLNMDMASFTFIFAEKEDPWCTRDVRIEDEDMNRGEQMNRVTLRIFADCLAKKHWPAPGEGNEGNERIGLSQSARDRIDGIFRHEGLMK